MTALAAQDDVCCCEGAGVTVEAGASDDVGVDVGTVSDLSAVVAVEAALPLATPVLVSADVADVGKVICAVAASVL